VSGRPVRKAFFHEEAEKDFQEASDYYAERSPLIADRFEAEVRRGVAFIENFPEASPVVYPGDIRRKVLGDRFKYSLFYVIEPDRIRVLAVAYQGRDPEYWRGRLP